jgi:RND family efflux transporter MFP subunit
MSRFSRLSSLGLLAGLPFLVLSGVELIAPVLAAETGLPHELPTTNPALTVELIQPQQRELPLVLQANGSVAAWQEAVIGAEVSGLRLAEIRGQVGDPVKKGQVLAVFDREPVEVDVAQGQAALAEAEANLQESRVNAERVRQVIDEGALSAQQVGQYLTMEKTAAARMRLAKAQLDQQLLRLRHTQVVAIDDGVISSRSAVLGAVANAGQELFRLVRQNRLEWRAEVTADELPRLQPGMPAWVEVPDIGQVKGKIRMVGPTLDPQSRNALVYVDLVNALAAGFKPGMFAHGEFQHGSLMALTVPQTALSLREGFSYVFRLAGPVENGVGRVAQVKVTIGRSVGDRVEILSGVSATDPLVAGGSAFLSDGDHVRVVK